MNNRAGTFKTNLSGDAKYKSFVPSPLPPNPPIKLDSEMTELLVKANQQMAILQRLASKIPNVALFVAKYVVKEALLSSQIEGTQATLEDVFDPMKEENTNRDVVDVINNIKAVEYAIQQLNELPLCNRLIKMAHAVLMDGVRGQERTPGEFRTSQNWIGGQGSSLKNAQYIPPTPEDMSVAMSDLEKYMNADDDIDDLIRAALIHYQFETIHPFLDGNGRVGRLLITLYWLEKGVLTTPALYISYYLKNNRIEYYDRMSEVRNKGNYEQWVKFFLRAVYESAEDAVNSIDELMALHHHNVAAITIMGRSTKTMMRLYEYLEANPLIEIKKTAEALDLSFNTISQAINRMMEIGILVQLNQGSRHRIFAYDAYLENLRKGTI